MYWVGYNVTFLFLFHANKINAIQRSRCSILLCDHGLLMMMPVNKLMLKFLARY